MKNRKAILVMLILGLICALVLGMVRLYDAGYERGLQQGLNHGYKLKELEGILSLPPLTDTLSIPDTI